MNLDNPDCNVIIELLKHKSFIGYDRLLGYSGLPANCQEKAISLISSGIDSPIASFEMIKRGVANIMISGGSEAAICKLGVAGFCAARSLSTSFNDLGYNPVIFIPL